MNPTFLNTEIEKAQIKIEKQLWKKSNKNRKLYRCYGLHEIEKLMELSNFANAIELKKK